MESTSLLPLQSFTRLEVKRLSNPTVLWRNRKLSQYPSDLDFGWCIPHSGDSSESYLPVSRTLLADRYGGQGVGRNGGSGRCAGAEWWQIKGVGPTPLVSESTPSGYAHGGLTLSEAIRETIWSQICQAVLPYGAVGSLAIVGTGTKTYPEADRSSKVVQRALLIRQFAIRPAHYMRAANYISNDRNNRFIDSIRTQEAIRKIWGVSIFPVQTGDVERDVENLNSSLRSMANRFAAQVAALRVRTIPHGALNCSNICCDGRLIDFGSMTALSDYGCAITSKGKLPFGREHLSFQTTFFNIVRYLKIYLPEKISSKILDHNSLWRVDFTQSLERHLKTELIRLTGICNSEIHKIPTEIREDLCQAMEATMNFNNSEPFKLEDMPTRMGRQDLKTAMGIMAESTAPTNEDALLDSIPSKYLRQQLMNAYARFFDAYSRTSGKDNNSIETVKQNGKILNRKLQFLYRQNLARSIVSLVESSPEPCEVDDFINETVISALPTLAGN